MAHGAAVIWQDENGAELGRFLTPGYDDRLFSTVWTYRTTCLRFVDPYGDTVFNQVQLPVLIAELEDVVARADDPDLVQSVRGLVTFLNGCDTVHTYVKVIGD